MQRIEIDGVPVVTAPGPGRTTAALVFGVGFRDETLAGLEVTHLVEHLAMGALPRTHLRCNAVTDVDTTTFFATGRPAAVGAFLSGVCRALSDLPTERMDLEVGVLQAEACATGHSTVGALWAARFGLAGPGLAAAGAPGPEYLTEELVREHARRWFVRGNAVLWCHGPLPADLRLPLPAGRRPRRTVPAARPQAGPVWTTGDAPGVGLLLSGEGVGDPALRIGVEVLQERLRDAARHAAGLSYSVDSRGLDLAPDRREVAVVVDARTGHEGRVADILWHEFTALCADGPTPAELAHAVAGFEEELDADEDEVTGAELADAAHCLVGDLPFLPVHGVLDAWRATTPERVARALARARATAVLYVPEHAGYAGPGAPVGYLRPCGVQPALPAGAVFRPPLLARLVDRRTRVALAVGEAGLGYRDADGDVHLVPWQLVEAAVPAEDGGVLVVGRDGCVVPVSEDLFGRRAVEAVTSRVPADRRLARPAAAGAVRVAAGVPAAG